MLFRLLLVCLRDGLSTRWGLRAAGGRASAGAGCVSAALSQPCAAVPSGTARRLFHLLHSPTGERGGCVSLLTAEPWIQVRNSDWDRKSFNICFTVWGEFFLFVFACRLVHLLPNWHERGHDPFTQCLRASTAKTRTHGFFVAMLERCPPQTDEENLSMM